MLKGWSSAGPARLAHAEIDPTARQEIERGNALGHAMRLVGSELHHAMAQTDALGALAGGTEKDFRRRGVRVLLEKMMLDLPRVVVAQPVGELDLGERVLQLLVLAPGPPRPGQLMFVEDAEFHGCALQKVAMRSAMVGMSLPGKSWPQPG